MLTKVDAEIMHKLPHDIASHVYRSKTQTSTSLSPTIQSPVTATGKYTGSNGMESACNEQRNDKISIC